MYIPWKKQISEALLLLSLPLVVAGCGGSGGGGGTAVISGIATKGPIAGARVGVYQLQQTGARGDLLGQGTSGAGGSFDVSVPADRAAGSLLITVTGQAGASYTSESTNAQVPFSAAESFNAVVDNFAPGQQVTVSPLTEAAFQVLPQILAAKPGPASADKIASAVLAANARIGSLFAVSDILAPPAGDASYRTALLVIDQMVEDSKAPGVITDTNAVMTLINLAFADATATNPGYQSYLQVVNAAAVKVKANNPLLAASIDALLARAANPPALPDFTDTTPPTAVSGLSATTSAVTATTSSVALSWSPSTDNNGVAGYLVLRDGNKIATVTTPGYTDPAVTSNITYSYVVVAFDAVGNRSLASTPLLVTPNQPSLNVTISGQLTSDVLGLPQHDIIAPTAPTSLTAASSSLTATTSSVALSWSAATDAVGVTGYEVFRDGVKIATVTTAGSTDSVLSGASYSYTVKAFDAAGNRSVASAPLSVTPIQASLEVIISGQVF